MHPCATLPTRMFSGSTRLSGILSCALAACVLAAGPALAQTTASTPATAHAARKAGTQKHRTPKKQQSEPAPVAQTPAPPPMPHWPANENPHPASVVWDANGLRITASNSSLRQILTDISTNTGAKVEGSIPDQRIYGEYGPGQARDVLSQLLQGSGYNVLLAGDIGQGAPREIVLTPRRAGGQAMQNAAMNRPRQQQDADDDLTEDQPQPEEVPQPQPPVQQPQLPNNARPGFGPGGPLRTPQQVMEEMQQQQLQQQQQIQQQMLQQQQQQQNPQQ